MSSNATSLNPLSAGDSNTTRHASSQIADTARPGAARPRLSISQDPLAESTPSQEAVPSHRASSSLLSRTNTQNARESREAKAQSKPSSTNTGLDPLSKQIFLRSNTEHSIAHRLRNPGRPDRPSFDNLSRPSSDGVQLPSNLADASREPRKGPSFLRRLGMRSSWRKGDGMQDSDSDLGDHRTDGTNAKVLTSVIGDGGGGFIPLHKEPPRYIRVKAHSKKTKDFNHLFLAQELSGTKRSSEGSQNGRAPATAVGSKLLKGGDAIWAAEFSLDGRYLAVAGKDQTVRVFAVISTPEERKAHEEEEAQNGNDGEKLSAPVFRSKPIREFEGHRNEVLALSWSKNNFLLSSSMDKTVRLWHVSRQECLCTFPHEDLVTSIAFHPIDDRFFLAGSLDAQLRLWSIPDKDVAYSASANEFITAVAFSPDGKAAICGTLSGMCNFFETEGLKLRYQIHVRSSRGKNAKGSKVTGIRTTSITDAAGKNQIKVLVSSNDSRLRIYGFNDKLLEVKFKGLVNLSSQIHARFSDDAKYIISGSEDRRAYIWPLNQLDSELKDKQPYECFDAHPEVVTTALMAPMKSRQLLSASGDPIYDLCNPPPITLLSLEESASRTNFSEEEVLETPTLLKQPETTPAYLNRSKHDDGNIIVTTDRTGTIKVFRQDCAYIKRQQSLWETGSKFSGKLAGVARSGSVVTRASGGGSRVQSRRGSLNLGASPVQSQHTSDRIMSWRQGVDSGKHSVLSTPARSERSVSPMKASSSPAEASATGIASGGRKPALSLSKADHPSPPPSPSTSILGSQTTVRRSRIPSQPPTPSFSLISASDPDETEEKEDGNFWNLGRWRGGIPGLRAASPSNNTRNGSSGEHTRTSSEALAASTRSRNRMSLGVNGSSKLRHEDLSIRRRSAAPALAMQPKETGSMSESIDSRLEGGDLLTMPKKRTDSGVGRMSGESKEGISL